jgi:hypothetical protein
MKATPSAALRHLGDRILLAADFSEGMDRRLILALRFALQRAAKALFSANHQDASYPLTTGLSLAKYH